MEFIAQIKVLSDDWGEAKRCDIERLLTDTASHMNRLLRNPFAGTIHVKASPAWDFEPRIHYRTSTHEPISIQLTARDRDWCQFAFQFSHEFCHVLSDYERLRQKPNRWFHEVICEVASLFTLRQMARRWPDAPPYSNWKDYAKHLAVYVENRLSRPEIQLPETIDLKEWLVAHEEELRKDPYQENMDDRPLNGLVAKQLLPIFESAPAGWNAISRLPDSSEKIDSYLGEWYSAADSIDKPFVGQILEATGHTEGDE